MKDFPYKNSDNGFFNLNALEIYLLSFCFWRYPKVEKEMFKPFVLIGSNYPSCFWWKSVVVGLAVRPGAVFPAAALCALIFPAYWPSIALIPGLRGPVSNYNGSHMTAKRRGPWFTLSGIQHRQVPCSYLCTTCTTYPWNIPCVLPVQNTCERHIF